MEYLGVAQMETTNSPKRVNGAESDRWYAQISDEKYLVLLNRICFWLVQNATGY